AVLARLGTQAGADVPTFNVGRGVATSVREIAGHLVDAWAGGMVPAALEFSGRSRPGDPYSLVADVRALNALGLACARDVDAGIAQYTAWFRQFREAHS
ncbi:MAG: hypothetical protein KGL99_05435, partial [Burkholderiales bacterium]|nr:hypothetical protein [Burkholderiales bacterium]